MSIRKFKSLDRPQIIELLRLNTPTYFSANEEKDLIYYLDNHADAYFVVEDKNKIIGCGGFNLAEDGISAKISWDIFHPESQGKGFGAELTTFKIQKIKEFKQIQILSVRTSQMAYKFYEKFGLELQEVVKDYWDVGFDLYRMECKLASVIF